MQHDKLSVQMPRPLVACMRVMCLATQKLSCTPLSVNTIAAVCAQVNTSSTGGEGFAALTAPVAGYLFAILSAFLSGFAAVYTEYLMKSRDDSLYWQNMQLYAFGIIFNAIGLTLADFSGGNTSAQPLRPAAPQRVHGSPCACRDSLCAEPVSFYTIRGMCEPRAGRRFL